MRLGIELADGFSGVTEELYAKWLLGVGRPDIDDSAADGKLSNIVQRFFADVADPCKPFNKLVRRTVFTDAKKCSELTDLIRRIDPRDQRLGGHHHKIGLAAGKMPKRHSPSLLRLSMRRCSGIDVSFERR